MGQRERECERDGGSLPQIPDASKKRKGKCLSLCKCVCICADGWADVLVVMFPFAVSSVFPYCEHSKIIVNLCLSFSISQEQEEKATVYLKSLCISFCFLSYYTFFGQKLKYFSKKYALLA